ncbi:MAG: nitroreductase family protein [Chloroflexi bacterium]|nr:nitroreductase family protein [Chloroflexota bacterium]
MSLFLVDREKCLRDGVCVDECPRFIIEMKDEDSYPVPIHGADELCINCGHCVTVCPSGALSLKTMTPESCPTVRADLLPTAEQVDHLLRSRRSIRAFEDRTVPREVLAGLIDIARYAPSGSNRQPVEWLVIYEPRDVRRLARLVEDWMRDGSGAGSYASSLARATEKGLDLICRGAPHVVIAHTPKGQESNGVIALTYLELAAYSLGLGTCWGGFINNAANNWPPLRQALALPEGRASCGAMLLGYPRHKYQRVPLRNEARITWR